MSRKLKLITSINQVTQYIPCEEEYRGVTTFHKLISLMQIWTMPTGGGGPEQDYNSRKASKAILGENKVKLAI